MAAGAGHLELGVLLPRWATHMTDPWCRDWRLSGGRQSGSFILLHVVSPSGSAGSQKLGSVREHPRPHLSRGQGLACKHLPSLHFVLYLLTSHWSKQVTWPSPESMWEGTTLPRGMDTGKYGSLEAIYPWNSKIP